MSSAPGLAVCTDSDRFLALAERWTPGEPFPVLAGGPLRRYQALFPARLPAVRAEPRAGTVVSAGGEFARAAGRLLAAATSRTHQHVPAALLLKELAEHQDELVAVVILADDLAEVGDWPGVSGARVGVLAARDEAALSCLIYRTLTFAQIPGDGVLVASHPLLSTGARADVVEFTGLARLRTERVRVLVLEGRGRECSLAFHDGIVCGRSDPVDERRIEVAPGLRSVPCLHGTGCFRTDLTERERLPAAEVNATLVFAYSCSSLQLGVSAYPASVSLALGLMDGTAVALIGVRGVHLAQHSTEQELAAALADEVPLGEVVYRMETRSRPMRSVFQSLGLVGDPGLVLPRPAGLTTHPALVTPPEAPLVDESAVARLTRLDQVVLPRLERLRWLQVDFGSPDELHALRDRVRRVASNLLDPALDTHADRLEAEAADVQHAALRRLVDRAYVQVWDFVGTIMSGLAEVEREAVECPGCGRPTAVRIGLAHRVEPLLRLRTLQCRRCGDVWWSTGGEDELSLRGPLDIAVRQAVPGALPRRLTNHGVRRARGAIGMAYKARKDFGLPPPQSVRCDLAAGETQEIAFPIDLRASVIQPDTHTTIVLALVDGVFLESHAMVRVS